MKVADLMAKHVEFIEADATVQDVAALMGELDVSALPIGTAEELQGIYCCDCGHERDVDPAALPLSWDTPVAFISTHMKCAACGSRKINTKPELYPGGGAGRAC